MLRKTSEKIAVQKRHVKVLESHNYFQKFMQEHGGVLWKMALDFLPGCQKKHLQAMENSGMEKGKEDFLYVLAAEVVIYE